MPSTKPDLKFDGDGVCSACRGAEWKDQIDWDARRREWNELCGWARTEALRRGNTYDCIVPVSGGKDSTFQVLTCVQSGLRPLGVSFEPTSMTPLGEANLRNLSRLCDVVQIRKNRVAYNKMARHAFRTVGDHDWPNHVGIFTTPVQEAVRQNIPLLIWGENCQLEYGYPNDTVARSKHLDRRWLEEFGGLLGLRVSDFLHADYGVSTFDLQLYRYPSIEDLSRVGVRGHYLGYYFKWDARVQVEKIKPFGWRESPVPIDGTYTTYENLDCALVGWHDYLKYVKFGFGRATDHACIDIRNGRMAREAAVDLVSRIDGKPPMMLDEFCDFLAMGRGEVLEIIDSFTNQDLFVRDAGVFKRDPDGRLIRRFRVQ